MSEEENLVKEINKEIKQDEYKKLWKKYGNDYRYTQNWKLKKAVYF